MRQLALFDEDFVASEHCMEHEGITYVAKPAPTGLGFLEVCGSCDARGLVTCEPFLCLSTERKDQKEVIWIRKEIQA